MREIERNLLSLLVAELGRISSALTKEGYTYAGPDIEVWQDSPKGYTSEIRLTLLKDGQIEDVLEFHVFRDGQPIVTAAEATDWFRTELGSLTRRK